MEKKVYYLELLLDLATWIIIPFINLYALHLGFSKVFIGSFNAILNLSYIITFFVSFFLIKYERIKAAFSLASIIWGLSFILLYYAKSESLFLIAILMRAISSPIISVSYTYVISKVFKEKTFGKVTNLSIIYASVGLFATITSSFLIREFSYPAIVFYLPFVFAILSVIVFNKIEIRDNNEITQQEIIKEVKKSLKDEKLIRYALMLFIFYFSVGIASPFFSVFLKEVVKKSEVEWAIYSSLELLSFLIFSSAIKRIGLKYKYTFSTLFFVSTFFISLLPLIWVVSKSYEIIIFASFLSGIFWNLFQITHLTYLTKTFSDIKKISFVGIFIGLGTSIGNIIGGIISQISLEQAFYVSFIFRLFSSYLFLQGMELRKIDLSKAIEKTSVLSKFFFDLFREFLIDLKKLKLSDLYNHKKNIHKS